jgi:hypothetical protein
MIKFREQVPSVYTDASRDFQYLGWLVNVVFNSVKHNIDTIYKLPNAKAGPELAELLAITLGFTVKRNYNQAQLAALANVIPSLLRYKGTKKAIEIAGNALIKASGTSGSFSCDLVDNTLEVVVPQDLVDLALFIDLLPYIIPAGLSCKLARKTQYKDDPYRFNIAVDSNAIKAHWFSDIEDVGSGVRGLSNIYNIDSDNKPIFSNFKEFTPTSKIANIGLLDNTVIPVLYSSNFSYEDVEVQNPNDATVPIDEQHIETESETNSDSIVVIETE